MHPSATRTVKESGFEVVLPRATSFRLTDLEPYRSLAGKHLKEMDLGWYDAASGRIILLELKGVEMWDAFDRDRKTAHMHLIENLGAKATDVLMVLSAMWSGTQIGAEFRALLPAEIARFPGDGKIKLFFLVDTPATRAPLMGPVKDELNRRLSGRLQLFGIRRVTLVDFDRAVSMGLPVNRA